MSCDCNGPALFCTREGLVACARVACDNGDVLTDWWQSQESAETCAQEWTAKTGVPHYVTTDTQCGLDAPVCATDYTLVSCPLDQVYDAWLKPNADAAQQCADRWNALSKKNGSPIHYEAINIAPRLFAPNAWQVVVK